MAKKKDKIKKVKKGAAKVSKAKPSQKKGKQAKATKKLKTKSARPSSATKKAVKKKSAVSKTARPTKKVEKKGKGTVLKSSKKASVKTQKQEKTNSKNKLVGKKSAPAKTVAKKSPEKATKAEKPVKAEKEKLKPSKQLELEKSAKKSSKRRKKKGEGDEDEPVIIDDILVEQIIGSTKKQSKAPKGPKIIKTFVNPMASLAVPADVKKGALPKKEPKGKFELEYVVRTSPGILYELLTTPSGLSEWFADDVNIRDGIFTFFWDGSEQKARLLGFKEELYIRMQWLDKPEGTYFEFRIQRDELTGDISLIIIDFADEMSDMQTSKLLWDSQVNKLLNVLGSN